MCQPETSGNHGFGAKCRVVQLFCRFPLNSATGDAATTDLFIYIHIYIYYLYVSIYIYEWRTKLLIIRNGHGQSGWCPIGCEGFVLPCYV